MNTKTRATLLIGALLSILLAVVAAPTASAATNRYVASNLTITVAGYTVTATVTIKSKSGAVTARQAGICLMTEEIYEIGFPRAQNVKITGAGTTIAKTGAVPGGSYVYYACLLLDNPWQWPTVDGPRGWITVPYPSVTTTVPTTTSTSNTDPTFTGAVSPN